MKFIKIQYLSNKERVCASDLEELEGAVIVNINLISSVSSEKTWNTGAVFRFCELRMSNGDIFYLPPSEGVKLRTIIINL